MKNESAIAIDKKLRYNLIEQAEKLHEGEKAFKRANILELLYVFLVAIILAMTLHQFVFQSVRVDGPSMLPNFYTNERVLAEKLTFNLRPPRRGDVVICMYDSEAYGKERVIKRVIGMPGDIVEITQGEIFINSEPIDESAYWNGVIDSDMPPIRVPERNIFVVGDNRNVSRDSRDPLVGTIPYERIIGRAAFVIWPLSSFGPVPHVKT